MNLKDLFIIISSYLKAMFRFRLFKITDYLYQSGHLRNADIKDLLDNHIYMVIDLEAYPDIVEGVPLEKLVAVYVNHPIGDCAIEPQKKSIEELWPIADLAVTYIKGGARVLSHCGAGCNRASLMNGIILYKMGYKGDAIVQKIRKGRPGALTNYSFKTYLRSLP